MSVIDTKTIKVLSTITLVGVFFFLLIISFFLVKASTGGVCGSDHNYNIDIEEATSLSYTINSYDYLIQSIDINNKNIGYYDSYAFCFNSVINASSTLELGIINNDGDVLAKDYFSNTTGFSCLNIGNYDFGVSNNLLGVKCFNCDSVNTLSLYGGVSSTEPTVSSSGVVIGDSIDYDIVGVKNCYSFVYLLFRYMIVYFFLMILVFLIIAGVNWFKGYVADGW